VYATFRRRKVGHALSLITPSYNRENSLESKLEESQRGVKWGGSAVGAEPAGVVRYLYKAWNERDLPAVRYFAIEVQAEGDRWASSCREVDENGHEKPDRPPVAPRFYGVTPEQAHRRMRDALENSYERVEPLTSRMED